MKWLIFVFFLVSGCLSDPGERWDKEIDLRDYGLLVQLKFNDPLNPSQGGKAHVMLEELEVDLVLGEGVVIRDGILKVKANYTFAAWSQPRFLPMTGSLDLETKIESGVWKLHLVVQNSPSEINFQLEADLVGWRDSSKTTKVHARLMGGPSLDIDIMTTFNGIWSGDNMGDFVQCEIGWNGARNSVVLSKNTFVPPHWSLQVKTASEHPMRPDPTYNFTLEALKGSQSGLRVTGSLEDLSMGIPWMDLGFNPWLLMGYRPWHLEGGPWTMLLELKTTETPTPGTSVTEFVLKFALPSEGKEIALLSFQSKKSQGTVPGELETQEFEISYSTRDGKSQSFNKANVTIDSIPNGFQNKFIKIFLWDEENQSAGAFKYMSHYYLKSRSMERDDLLLWELEVLSQMNFPTGDWESLSGIYSWTDLRNNDTFAFNSEERFTGNGVRVRSPSSGSPLIWLGELLGSDQHLLESLKFETGNPLPFYQLARLLGVEANERIGRPAIELKISRELVFEKNAFDLLLSFYDHAVNFSGTLPLVKLKHLVELHRQTWNLLDFEVSLVDPDYSKDYLLTSLMWEYAPEQQVRIGAGSKHNHTLQVWKNEVYFKISLRPKSIHFGFKEFDVPDDLDRTAPSVPSSVRGVTTRALDVRLDLMLYPGGRTGGVYSFEWKTNPRNELGGEASVFKYDGRYAYTFYEEVLKNEFALEINETLAQTEESPFHSLFEHLGWSDLMVTQPNVSRLYLPWTQTMTRLFHYNRSSNVGKVVFDGIKVASILPSPKQSANYLTLNIEALAPQQSPVLCLFDACSATEIEAVIHIPTNNFDRTSFDLELSIGNKTTTKTKLEWEWISPALNYKVKNELLLPKEKDHFDVSEGGEIRFDGHQVPYFFTSEQRCRGRYEETCTRFGLAEMRNVTIRIDAQDMAQAMLRVLWRFKNDTEPTGVEVDVDKFAVFGFN